MPLIAYINTTARNIPQCSATVQHPAAPSAVHHSSHFYIIAQRWQRKARIADHIAYSSISRMLIAVNSQQIVEALDEFDTPTHTPPGKFMALLLQMCA